MRITAARAVRHALEQLGVRYTFGIPGVHTIELYDELQSSQQIAPVLVTHEGSGAFMADAISRLGDSIGTLLVVPAAGLTHAMSGVGEAFLDGIPMLVISGGVRSDVEQHYQLHDVDQQALMATLTKATFKIAHQDEVVETVYEAYRVATSGEPGPVYIEVPANLQLFSGEVKDLPAFVPAPAAEAACPDALEQAAGVLLAASKPGIFVGWGARHVSDDIARIAELLGAPVATTLQGLSAFPADHPLHTGMGFGPSAVPAAENAFAGCDAMLAVGTRFAEICTGSYGAVPPQQLVHIDINPDAIGANHPTAVGIAADARAAVPALADMLAARSLPRDSQALVSAIAADKAAYRDSWLAHDSQGRVNPAVFFGALRAALRDDAIVVADDGNHTFMTAELMPMHAGGLYLSPTDFNCMGYCVPASIAAKLAQPERQVAGIVGDGAFLMTGMEILTAVGNGLGLAWFVFNDGALAQIAQAQEIPYQRRSCTDLPALNYQAFAAAVGCSYLLVEHNDSAAAVVQQAVTLMGQDKPVLVEVRIDYSRKTRFTEGAVKTNLARFDTRNKLRFVGRALWRKVYGAPGA
jgi:acetolactate synthase-1/2/3 large subunit